MKDMIHKVLGALDAIFVFVVTLITLFTKTRTKEMNAFEWILMIILLIIFCGALFYISQIGIKQLIIVIIVSILCKIMLADVLIFCAAAAIWVLEALWYVLRVLLKFVRWTNGQLQFSCLFFIYKKAIFRYNISVLFILGEN